eukprot:scaffold33586_cov54-Phaeocystis_antarctica.AAC.6
MTQTGGRTSKIVHQCHHQCHHMDMEISEQRSAGAPCTRPNHQAAGAAVTSVWPPWAPRASVGG